MNNAPSTHSVALGPDLSLTLTEAGSGRPALILHGGGGPRTVAGIASHLAETMHAITPTHPGWNGTPRPEWFNGVDDLAIAYLQYLADQGLRDVLVVGSSLGGWVASEMAVRDHAGLITGLVLIDAGGVQIPGEPIRDIFALDPRGLAEYAYHDAAKFFVDPTTLPPEALAGMRGNMATLRVVGGEMHDVKLLRRLGRVRVPTLALWGESDRIMTPAYGKAYAAAFANARFAVVEKAGHLPQLEQPAATFALIDQHAQATAHPALAAAG